MSHNFPPSFLLGAATSAYQIEGVGDGRGPVVWDDFLAAGLASRGDTAHTAADHFYRVDEDVELMKQLGLEAYRFSISWARVMPDGRNVDRRGLEFYRRLVDCLRERDIVPAATLYHLDLPAVFGRRRGWADRETALRFAEYAGAVTAELADDVELWMTLNEPLYEAWHGYGDGAWPPRFESAELAFAALHHMLLGHGLAVRAMRAASPAALQIGLALGLSPCVPASGSAADRSAAEVARAHTMGIVLDPLFHGHYPAAVLKHHEQTRGAEAIRASDLAVISTPVDFVGINYYVRRYFGEKAVLGNGDLSRAAGVIGNMPTAQMDALGVAEVHPPGLPQSPMGWPVEPDGLRELLVDVSETYGAPPLYVTENGIGLHDYVDPDGVVNDEERIEFLDAHLQAARAAIAAGVDLRGYFAWSLIDNFEWHQGFGPRFGLVYVDYATQRRVPKRSFSWFRELLLERRSSPAIAATAMSGPQTAPGTGARPLELRDVNSDHTN